MRISLFLYPICLVMLFSVHLFSQNWQLVWSDEFDGAKLDSTKWDIQLGDGSEVGLPSGWGNNERQYYRKENIELKDGNLIITAKKEKYEEHEYTSARIRTKNKGDWTYGKFEIRAKMPIGQGIWPAIWMLPTDRVYGGSTARGEIHILE